MKKIILLFMASGIYLHAYSQDKLVKYQGEVSLGYAFGVGDIKIDKSSLQIINGVRIGTYFAAGVGVGFDYCGKSSLDSYRLGFSLFGDIKGYLPVSPKISLFLATDIGGGWGQANALGRRDGVIVVPAIGASFKVSPQSAINLSLTYTYQDGRGERDGSWRAPNYNALGLKAGFQF